MHWWEWRRVSQLLIIHKQMDWWIDLTGCGQTCLPRRWKKKGTDWDEKLPFVLYAYRVSVQESTKDSPFFLLYGRDPRLPTQQAALSPICDCQQIDIDTYKSEVMKRLSFAWELAPKQVKRAEYKKKKHHDHHAQGPGFKVGDCVLCTCQQNDLKKLTNSPDHSGALTRFLLCSTMEQKLRWLLNRVCSCPCEIPGSDKIPCKEDTGSNQSLNRQNSKYSGPVLEHDTSAPGTDAEPTFGTWERRPYSSATYWTTNDSEKPCVKQLAVSSSSPHIETSGTKTSSLKDGGNVTFRKDWTRLKVCLCVKFVVYVLCVDAPRMF